MTNKVNINIEKIDNGFIIQTNWNSVSYLDKKQYAINEIEALDFISKNILKRLGD